MNQHDVKQEINVPSQIMETTPYVLSRKEKKWLDLKIAVHTLKLLLKRNKNPLKIIRELSYLLEVHQVLRDRISSHKTLRLAGRYHSNPYFASWPSSTYDELMNSILDRHSSKQRIKYLPTVILSITNDCPLDCKHCLEGNNLNSRKDLPLEELRKILKKLQDKRVAHIHFSGGEPLNRYEDILKLLEEAKNSSEFWIFTSGWGLKYDMARRLKEMGLTGVFLSLDHFYEAEHDEFRGRPGSYEQVMNAAVNARKAGLLLCLSLCATREFTSEENLNDYIKLAKSLGAGFIQILEPQNTGRYAGEDIQLEPEQISLLERFYLSMNTEAQHSDMPVIIYAAYEQRKVGCLSGELGYAYISANGDVHPCPFCHSKCGNILVDELEDILDNMDRLKCRNFNNRS
ncbi:MAG: radical SAM protein [Spirochaetota bacterium]|nr:radical SAM protein [Spirochaetota bacterium]